MRRFRAFPIAFGLCGERLPDALANVVDPVTPTPCECVTKRKLRSTVEDQLFEISSRCDRMGAFTANTGVRSIVRSSRGDEASGDGVRS
jgi:hypothetical protein